VNVTPIWDAIQNLWNGILDLTSRLVMPDWANVISLLPVFLAVAVAIFLVWVIRRWATAGPRRRGRSRVQPKPPAGVHMPGPSFAPIFAAIGAFLVFFGLVFGGWMFWLGVVALALTLLYWLREGLREYERIDPVEHPFPAVVHDGPPPGVHMPGPSFRPLLVAMAATVVFFGLVFGLALLVAGLIVLAGTLIGWLRDARREYVATETADQTGHLENAPDPQLPTRGIAVSAVIVAIAIVINAGIIPSTESANGGDAGASPGASAGASPGASAAPSASPADIPAADVTVTAKGFAFDPNTVTATAGTAFTIAFVNDDAGVPHDIVIRDSAGTEVFRGDPVTGPKAVVYSVPALPAGSYPFVCSFHANMTGTITSQ
jgi:plastocyanin